MADGTLAANSRAALPLPIRRARVMRRIEQTRAAIGLEWMDFRAAVADGDLRSRAAIGAVRTTAKWGLALSVLLWVLRRRRSRLTFPRAALLAALARAAAKQAFRLWHRGERHVEH
jgi:hypothetical protein